LSWVYDQITTSSGTESRKVGNRVNWDAQFVAEAQQPPSIYTVQLEGEGFHASKGTPKEQLGKKMLGVTK